MKTRFKHLLLPVLLVLAIILIAVYRFYFSPQARAASHLAFVHDAITQMHPAVLDKNAVAFHAWHSVAYEKAKALLSQVHSTADETALLNYYFAGYQDSHLAGGIVKTPYKFMESADTWAGWLLKAKSSGYEVAYSLGGEDYPAVGAQLISCDNQAIDEILQKHYALYIDTRWHILQARSKAALAFTQNTYFSAVLNRPEFKHCKFQSLDGSTQEYSFHWQAYDAELIEKSMQWRRAAYKFPAAHEFAPQFFWVAASDFQLNSTEAYHHHQKLLHDLEGAGDTALVVFDLRGNNGGSSLIGHSLLKTFFGKENYDFLRHEYAAKLPDSDAQFRASWSFYWSYDFLLKQQKANHGENDDTVKSLQSLLNVLKKSLDAHENFFLQSSVSTEVIPAEEITASAPSWKFQGPVFVVTDQDCLSACLDFVDMIKLIPGSVHLGQPTNADTVYTQVAPMWHEYQKEALSFFVPVKKYNKRLRVDNQAYVPDVIYEGDITKDQQLETWVKQQIALTLLQ